MKSLITSALLTTLAISSTFAMETSGSIAATGTESPETVVTTSTTGTTLTGKALINSMKDTMKEEIKTLRSGEKATIKATWGQFRSEYNYVNKYFKKGLTKAERATIKEIFANNKSALDATRDAFKKKTFTGDMLATRLAAIDTLYAALTPYVDPAKLESYNSFVQAKKDVVSKNYNLRKDTQEKAKEIRANYKSQIKALKPIKSMTGATAK